MRVLRYAAMLFIASTLVLSAQTSPLTAEQRAQFHGPYSQPEEPFRLIGNIYYVGAKNIASYLVVTPQGSILIDTGTTEMTPVITSNVEKLGFKVRDIKIMLSSHAHFDHIGGHAAMKKLTGARIMAIKQDADALEAGKDLSPLGDEGWMQVKVDRVLKDGDTVALGGTTLRAVWAPGHTPGCTVWTATVPDAGQDLLGCDLRVRRTERRREARGQPAVPDARGRHARDLPQAEDAQTGHLRDRTSSDALRRKDRTDESE